MYVPLWCKSNFSFLEGASKPAELVEEAVRLGLPAIALTDRDGVYGIVRAHVAAREHGIKLLLGSQLTLEDGSQLVVLVQNRVGYTQLCRLLTRGRLRSPKGQCSVSWDEVCAHAEGLLALWGGENSRLIGPVAPDALVETLKEAFGDRLYALLVRHLRPEEAEHEAILRERAHSYGLPLVASTEVLYHHAHRRPIQDVVTCVRHGVTLVTAGRRLKPNAEHGLKATSAFNERFSDDPAAVQRTLEVASRCTFSLADLRYRYPLENLPDGTTTHGWLRQRVYTGAEKRYEGPPPADVVIQLERELALIEQLDFGGYFLTMRDIVDFCEDQEILCQGRGSAANSAVCYCLGITAVDPVRMKLLFERFLSVERAEAPDIDLDIEHERREEVIQHVYRKYGRTHAAMVAVVISYRTRSAVRDIGKVLGIPETELSQLAKVLGYPGGGLSEETLKLAGLDGRLPVFQQMFALAKELEDCPRHLSIHPGGFLLGHEPVHDLVPIENGTMADRTVIQWDKDDVEALGLFKVDLLGLGALNHTHRCFDLIQKHYGKTLTMAGIPADDPKTYELLRDADTLGVFQVESRAQMAMLPRLRPENYYDLVIQISIVRPGPITGGMVHPYLRRRRGLEEVDYPHPDLEPVLLKTLGIPLFQEQVMKLAMVAADYTPGEADQLRRDMAAWRKKGSIERHRERLVSRMQEKGIALEFAERVFKQIEGFGDYGFPEAHAASFALISYVGSYLRAHYLAAFSCSLLNAQPMGFYSAATIVEDARRKYVEFRAIDIRQSAWDCTLEPTEPGFAIRMGLRYVKGLTARERARIEATMTGVPPETLEDFIWASRLDENPLVALAEAGAFDTYGKTRREALWIVRGLAHVEPLPLALGQQATPSFQALSLFETINWDYKRSQHSALGHPLEPIRPLLTAKRLPDADTLKNWEDGERVRYAGMVICRQRPSTAAGVTFMTMEDETGFVNLVIWTKVFERFKLLIKTTSFLGVTGTLQVQEGVRHLIARSFWKPDIGAVPAPTPSYDFH